MTDKCSKCLFAEDKGSSDIFYCWKIKKWMKVNDYPCGYYINIKEIREVRE